MNKKVNSRAEHYEHLNLDDSRNITGALFFRARHDELCNQLTKLNQVFSA